MAVSKHNIITQGLSGMFGNTIVFKTVRGRTVVCNRPAKPRSQSAQQQENRSRFKRASQWAKNELLDPQRKAYYKKKADKLKLPNAYTAAITDYMRAPKLMEENSYGGATTYFVTKKNFDLKNVDVVVTKINGETEVRTTPPGRTHFRVSQDEISAGVLVLVTEASGLVKVLRC